jgi:hypothetical protein
LVYADEVNLPGDNINTINKNTETLIDPNKEVGLEVNAEKSENMFSFHHQNSGQNHDIKIASRSFENVAQFKYLGTACYHSVQNLFCSRLLSNNIKIRIHKTITLPVVLCGRETWSLILSEGHLLREFENRVLRRIFGQKRDEVMGGRRKLLNENFITCIPRQLQLE